MVAEGVKAASQKSLDVIKKARHEKNDQLRKMKTNRTLNPDDYQKAHDEMEKVVKRGNEEIKRVADGARRVFESWWLTIPSLLSWFNIKRHSLLRGAVRITGNLRYERYVYYFVTYNNSFQIDGSL
jgi:hypothetical protein